MDTVALQPVAVAGGQQYRSVSSGCVYACGVTTSDVVQCWGYNQSGQLGLGDTANRGDDIAEMGDLLPAVKLFSDVW